MCVMFPNMNFLLFIFRMRTKNWKILFVQNQAGGSSQYFPLGIYIYISLQTPLLEKFSWLFRTCKTFMFERSPSLIHENFFKKINPSNIVFFIRDKFYTKCIVFIIIIHRSWMAYCIKNRFAWNSNKAFTEITIKHFKNKKNWNKKFYCLSLLLKINFFFTQMKLIM